MDRATGRIPRIRRIRPAAAARGLPPFCAWLGSEVSRGGFPKNVIVQREACEHLLQARILALHILEAPGLIHSQSAVLQTPKIIRLLTLTRLLALLPHRPTPRKFHRHFAKLQDNLLRRETLPWHHDLLHVSPNRVLKYRLSAFMWAGHDYLSSAQEVKRSKRRRSWAAVPTIYVLRVNQTH